tara:strand:- start:201 stop:347 length:147 start_codon:yes stop_codon:yes gene_type:complete
MRYNENKINALHRSGLMSAEFAESEMGHPWGRRSMRHRGKRELSITSG